ncbi:DUF58 domain-containing protein [Pseudomonas sp. LP_7_YM]|uniref:DUF58 domain-containing protein n=1 Tax=Pseudomonas sp. LP_7_YM TaxID=2485137 RepID=UPI00105EA549|nr:DUF58 domain-containing protein [Pseudomonas sp. LP_7_YM]TDV70025.1 uncharacterized protein (DUF58 family) [Pseudomonas sp. LP_7_YM]
MKQLLKPSKRLLWWLATLTAFATVLGIFQALNRGPIARLDGVFWALVCVIGALGLLDALWLWRLRSPRVQRHLPGSLALGRWCEVRLTLEHDLRRSVALALIDHGPQGPGNHCDVEYLTQDTVLRPQRNAQLTYRLRPTSRGLFTFERIEIQLRSPLRLWLSRRYLPVFSSARVYPDFARLHNGQLLAVDNWLSRIGIRQRQRRGLGLEFNQLREFREGDSLRQIDWKATARQRTPIAREYQDERDQQIVFALDCGRRMRSQDGELTHFDHALNACLLLGYVALRQGDAVGVSTFAAQKDRHLAPVKGAAQLNVLLNHVYDLNSTQRPADYSGAIRQLLIRQKRRALVVLVTNLRDEDDEDLLGAVKRLSRHHRVLVASLREEVLDEVRQAPVQTWQQALDYCGTVDFLNARASLHERLTAHGIPVLDVRPAELGPQLVSRYLSWKKAGTL